MAALPSPFMTFWLGLVNSQGGIGYEYSKVSVRKTGDIDDVKKATKEVGWDIAAYAMSLYNTGKVDTNKDDDPPSVAEVLRALNAPALRPNFKVAGLAEGSYLIAQRTGAGGGAGAAGGGGAAAAAGDESGVARLTAAFEAQTIELKAVLHQVSTEDKAFTRATTGMVNQLLYKRGLREGVLALPATIGDFYPTTALSAFSWTRDGALKKAMGEPEASKVLLPLLRSFIEDGATPAVINPIVDVQNLSATAPMVVEEAGIANFKGVPDIVILRNGLDSPVGLPFSSTVVSVDWKTPEAMNERGVIQNLGYLHAIALSERTSSAVNPPAFFTDMVSRVRAWELVGSTIYALHPAQGDLTLREGVALMRFYIARADSMAAAEGPAEHDCNWRRALPLLGPASDLPSGGMGRGHSGPESSPTSAGLGKAGSKVGEASLASSPEDPTVCYSTDSSPEAELVALSLSIRAAAAELRCFGCANLDAVFGDTE